MSDRCSQCESRIPHDECDAPSGIEISDKCPKCGADEEWMRVHSHTGDRCRIRQLEREKAALVEVAKFIDDHRMDCDAYLPVPLKGRCTCGLDAALAACRELGIKI